jgi:hypothetical protein
MKPQAPSASLIERTLETWQPRAERRLTDEDAREIIANMSGFLLILIEWDARDRMAGTFADVGEPAP